MGRNLPGRFERPIRRGCDRSRWSRTEWVAAGTFGGSQPPIRQGAIDRAGRRRTIRLNSRQFRRLRSEPAAAAGRRQGRRRAADLRTSEAALRAPRTSPSGRTAGALSELRSSGDSIMMFADTSSDCLSLHCWGSRRAAGHCRLSMRILGRSICSLLGMSLPFFPLPGSRGPCYRRFRAGRFLSPHTLLTCLRVTERSEFGHRVDRRPIFCVENGAGARPGPLPKIAASILGVRARDPQASEQNPSSLTARGKVPKFGLGVLFRCAVVRACGSLASIVRTKESRFRQH